jgi:hypothetical protein
LDEHGAFGYRGRGLGEDFAPSSGQGHGLGGYGGKQSLVFGSRFMAGSPWRDLPVVLGKWNSVYWVSTTIRFAGISLRSGCQADKNIN